MTKRKYNSDRTVSRGNFPCPTQRPVAISGLKYMEEFAYPIGPVPFREAGLYEYQLWADGFDEPIARERVMARE